MKPRHNHFPAIHSAVLIASFACICTGLAAPLYKVDNPDDLNLPTSWSTTSGAQTPNPESLSPADVWYFNDVTMLSSKTVAINADITIGGLALDNTTATAPGNTFNVAISSSNTLTLNGASVSGTGVDGGSGYNTAGIVLNRSVGGTLSIGANIAIGATQQWVTSRALTVTGGINLNANTLSFNTAGASNVMTLSGVISGTGNLTKSAGPGTLALANPANTFSGIVTLIGGSTTITKLADGGLDSSLGNGSSSIILNGSNLIHVGADSGSTDRAIDMRAGAGVLNNSASGEIAFNAANVLQGGAASARTLTLNGSNTGNNTFNSILGDSGSGANISRLQKSGAGKWAVSAAHTYTGATIINQGTLVLGGSSVLGGLAGGTLDEGNIWFSSVQANAALHFQTVANLGPADQIRFRNTGGTAGNGGALVYTGTTEETLGKTIQCDSSIGIRLESDSTGGRLLFNGAFIQTNRRLYLGGSGTGDNTLATPFAGTGGITKRGNGKWILSGTNTYTGATLLEQGTLVLGASDSLASTAVSIGNGTLATASSVSDTLGTLDPTAAATITIGSGATLAFADSSLIDWTDGTLALTGTFVSGSSLRFGTTSAGLTTDQLNKISAAGFSGFALNETGYLTATAAAGYSSWASTNGTAGAMDEDHDNDGVTNGVEYFIGGPTGNTTGFTALPGVTNTGGILSVTWTKAAGYTGTYPANFVVETSPTLANPWTPATEGTGPDKVEITGNSVTYTFPAGTTNFARLKVTGP